MSDAASDGGPFGKGIWARLRGRLFHTYFLIRRPMTLGVRAIVHDRAADTIFLIRHTYVPGWQFPGGGVETGETLEDALRHELLEEGNIEMTGPPRLVAVYQNRSASRRDHVALFMVTDYLQRSPKIRDREIAEAGFFPRNELPAGTTRATKARLAAVFGGEAVSPYW